MAKIKITESELKQVIRESVEDIINEAGNALAYSQLSDADKDKWERKYRNNMANRNALGFKYGNKYGNRTPTSAAEFYAAKQAAKANRTGKVKLGQADYQSFQKRLQDAVTANGEVCKKLGITDGDINKAYAKIDEINNQIATLQGQVTDLEGKLKTANGTVAQLTKDKQALGAQLAQARNQAVRSGAAQPAVNQNQTVPAAKPIPQQTARPAAQTPGTAIAQK